MSVENPMVGQRVSYEDMANPFQTGTIIGRVVSEWQSEWLIRFDAVDSQFGPEFSLPARDTVSSLHQAGWKDAS